MHLKLPPKSGLFTKNEDTRAACSSNLYRDTANDLEEQSTKSSKSLSSSKRWQNFVDATLRLFVSDKIVKKIWRLHYRFSSWRLFGTIIGSLILTISLQYQATAQLGQQAEQEIESTFSPYLDGATDLIGVTFSSGRMLLYFVVFGLVGYGLYDMFTSRGSNWYVWASIAGGLAIGVVLIAAGEGAIFGT